MAIGWLFFDRQAKEITNSNKGTDINKQSNIKTTDTDAPTEKPIVSIYPTDSQSRSTTNDFYTAVLPNGLSVEKVYESYNIVKSAGNDKYLIASFIEDNSDIHPMSQRVAEGIESIATVKTKSGTDVHVLKTPYMAFLASCKPTADNCYLNLNDKKLNIILYQLIPRAQSATKIDYSSESAKEMITDLKSIATSLNI